MSRSPSASASPVPRRRTPSTVSEDEAPANKRKRSLSPLPRERIASPPSRRRRSQSPAPRVNGGRNGNGDVDVERPKVMDIDPHRRREREAALLESQINAETRINGKANGDGGDGALVKKNGDASAKVEFADLLGSRSGGTYIPPARLRAMQAEAAKDKTSAEYQRLSWDALRKSINGLINKVNVSNIKHVVPELFGENLIRGRGLFARSMMRAQASSLPFTPIFAGLVAIVNTKLPQVGELVLVRLISQFRRAYKRNDKTVCHATSTFIGHLVNQYVAHEIVALQILLLCLDRPTDDSIEVAVGFMREVGLFLSENSPKANNAVYERFRAVLHEGAISKRCQYMIEVLFQVRKDKYKDNPSVPEGLDLVEEEEQITHRFTLDDELQVQESLNLFKVDSKFLDNEERYNEIKKEILGDSDDDSGSEVTDSDYDSEQEEVAPDKGGITDMTETNLINLRKTIYLTITNSLNFEEAVHKLMKINIPEGKEIEMSKMIVECCSQDRSYNQFFGLIGERFCKLNRIWTDTYQEAFAIYYDTIHRYETNKLRNIGRFFGHLLASDGISWAVLNVVHMNEEETTSSSRIFVKIMIQEMNEQMGINRLVERFQVPDLKPAFGGMFPMDNPKNTRFAINYFTSIGLGKVTEEMRTYLQNAPKMLAAQHAALAAAGGADDDSSDSDSSSDLSDTDSSDLSDTDLDTDDESDYRGRRGGGGGRRRSSTPPPRRRGGKHSDDYPSPPRRRYTPPPYRSSSPPRARRGPNSPPHGRSPPRRRYDDDSPPPRRRRYSDDSPPPPSRRRPDSPASPSRRRRDDGSPPNRRYRDDSPPSRRNRDDSPPSRPARYRDDSPPRRRASPPPRGRPDDDTPPGTR